MPRDLDYAPLHGWASLRDRWRETRAHGQLTYTLALGGLFTSVGVVCAVVASVNGSWSFEDGTSLFAVGGLVFGAVVLASLAWIAGDGAALRRFARANGLEVAQHGLAPHYANSAFAAGTHVVYSAVRTPDEQGFVEVGERFPARGNYGELRQNLGVYLRVRLSGPALAGADDDGLLTGEERTRLATWAGDPSAEVEVRGDELTVLGRGRLAARREGRVRECFALAELLRERAEQTLVPAGRDEAAAGRRTTSGVTLPVWERPAAPAPTKPRNPFVMALALLGTIVALAFGVALVMSLVEGVGSGSRPFTYLVLAILLPGLFAVMGWLFRWLVRGRRA